MATEPVQYVTTREAAALLGLSKSRVDQFCRSIRGRPPRLPSVMMGVQRVIPLAAVMAFKARQRKPGKPKGRAAP